MKLTERLAKIESQLDRIESLLSAKQAGKRAYTKRKILHGECVRLTKEEEAQIIGKLGKHVAPVFIKWFDDTKTERGYVYASDYKAMQRWGFEAWEKHLANTKQHKSVQESPRIADDNEAERKWRESCVDSES